MATPKKDSEGRYYFEVQLDKKNHLRFTFVPKKESAYGQDSVGLQIRQEPDNLRERTEIPVAAMADAVRAMIALATATENVLKDRAPPDEDDASVKPKKK